MAIDYRGIDIKLNTNFDIILNAKDDFVTVLGDSNVQQALQQKLVTQLGELTLHPNYGSELFSLIGQGGSETLLTRAKTTTREALLQDPRINRISNLRVRFTDATRQQIKIEVKVILLGETTPINLVYDLFIT